MSGAVLLLFAGLQPTDGNPDALGEAYLVMDVADALLQSLHNTGPPATAGQLHEVPDADVAPASQQATDSRRDAACQSLALCIEVSLVCCSGVMDASTGRPHR
jgi:hypothetical protein